MPACSVECSCGLDVGLVVVWLRILVAQALSVIILCVTKRFVVSFGCFMVLICSSMECGGVVVPFCGL